MNCERCGRESATGNAFCGGCGAALEQTLGAERRQITVMFCDMAGSTELSTRLDPEDLHELIATYYKICDDVVARYDGHIAQYLGDGILAYFGYPAAHEDDPARALRAALEVHGRLHAARDALEKRWGHAIEARIGVHTGPVVVGEMGSGAHRESLALGETTNLAARLQSEAELGGVLASETTVSLAGLPLISNPRGALRLRGIPVPIQAHDIRGIDFNAGGIEIADPVLPLVGRVAERDILVKAMTQLETGHSETILLSGEPGMGKSRLLEELRKIGNHELQGRILTLQCAAHDSTRSFGPIVDMLRSRLFANGAVPDRRTLGLAFAVLGEEAEVAVELLAPYFGADVELKTTQAWIGEQRNTRTVEIIADLVSACLGQGAALIAIEDTHWADPSTLNFVRVFSERAAESKRLIVITARPEMRPETLGISGVREIVLGGLSEVETAELIGHVAGTRETSAKMAEEISDRSDGVPLFAEQLVRDLLEREKAGLLGDEVPRTLRDLLAARLDRLGSSREVAQRIAVLGRDFPLHWASIVCEGVRDLDAKLAEIEKTGLASRHGERLRFTHALVQDAARQGLLRRDRRKLHSKCALAFEAGLDNVAAEQPALIAHHWSEAGNMERATDAWLGVARHELGRAGIRESEAAIERGLGLLEQNDDAVARDEQELRFRFALSPVILAVDGITSERFLSNSTRSLDLVTGDSDPRKAYMLMAVSMCHVGRGEHPEAALACDAAVDAAIASGVEMTMGLAYGSRARIAMYCGELDRIYAGCDRSEELWPEGTPHLGGPAMAAVPVDSAIFRAIGLWLSGFPDQALEEWKRGHELAIGVHEASGSELWARMLGAWLHRHRGEMSRARELAREGIEIARRTGVGANQLEFEKILLWIRCELEASEQAAHDLAEHAHAAQASGRGLMTSCDLQIAALTCGRAGNPERGLEYVAEAIAHAERWGEKYAYPEMLRTRAELRLAIDGDIAAALEELGSALKVANAMRMRSWALRIATDIANLHLQQMDSEAAYAVLAPIYQSFEEGHETRDLIDARIPLECAGSAG